MIPKPPKKNKFPVIFAVLREFGDDKKALVSLLRRAATTRRRRPDAIPANLAAAMTAAATAPQSSIRLLVLPGDGTGREIVAAATTAMPLAWLEGCGHGASFAAASRAVVAALNETLSDPSSLTRDPGGTLGTKAFTAKIIEALSRPR